MSDKKEKITKNQDLEKAIDEIDILNPKNKAVHRIDSETIQLTNKNYKLVENYKDAFDLEQMENRYSDYLLKYDYIVGDIAYQKLRLRGFFEDYRKSVPIDMKISHLEDYLVEFCSFGSPYFVLERVEKRKENPESYFKKKKNSRNKKRKKSKSHHKNKRKNKKTQKKKARRKNKKDKKKGEQSFKIRKKK